jgi:hypothetical protein
VSWVHPARRVPTPRLNGDRSWDVAGSRVDYLQTQVRRTVRTLRMLRRPTVVFETLTCLQKNESIASHGWLEVIVHGMLNKWLRNRGICSTSDDGCRIAHWQSADSCSTGPTTKSARVKLVVVSSRLPRPWTADVQVGTVHSVCEFAPNSDLVAFDNRNEGQHPLPHQDRALVSLQVVEIAPYAEGCPIP